MIYNLVIYIYLFGVKVAGLFSAKPAKMVKGHREVFDILRNKIDKPFTGPNLIHTIRGFGYRFGVDKHV